MGLDDYKEVFHLGVLRLPRPYSRSSWMDLYFGPREQEEDKGILISFSRKA